MTTYTNLKCRPMLINLADDKLMNVKFSGVVPTGCEARFKAGEEVVKVGAGKLIDASVRRMIRVY